MTTRLSYLALALLGLSACSGQGHKPHEPRSVETITIALQGEGVRSTLPARVKAGQEAQLSFRVAGQIAKIYATPGRAVRRGEVLAQLDARDYSAQLSATEAEYQSVKAQAERIIKLHSEGSVSTNDYDKAVGALGQITQKLAAHRNTLSYTRLVAPFDGYVQESLRKAGETVGAGMTVLTLYSGGKPMVELDISTVDYLRRASFGAFSCTSDAFPDKVFPLELVSIDPIANLNQLHTMRLAFASGQEEYPTVGMSVIVSIESKAEAGQAEGYTLPLTAVWEREGKSYVWVLDDSSRTRAQAVTIHQVKHNGELVVSGLSAGAEVVSAGASALEEGQEVRPLPKVTETNVGKLL